MVMAEEVVAKTVVVEAVEHALHAFGVGRLDIAFEVLRALLVQLDVQPR